MRIASSLFLSSVLLATVVDGARADTVPLRESVPHITVTGSAMANVVPDEAFISIGISREKSTANAAAAEMAAAASAVVAEIKEEGVEVADIATTSTSLSRVYDEVTQSGRTKQVFRAYHASEDLSIHVRDVAKASRLARALIDKGANEFHAISFGYTKQREKVLALQGDAMRDALKEARSYTDALGLKLGRVIQIGDEGSGGGVTDIARPSPRMARKAAVSPPADIPVEPGLLTFNSSIAVTWEIDNGH
jgi:uncharacterized protein